MEVINVVLLIQWVRGFNHSSAHGFTSRCYTSSLLHWEGRSEQIKLV